MEAASGVGVGEGVSWHWRGAQLRKLSWRSPEPSKKVPPAADTLKAQ